MPLASILPPQIFREDHDTPIRVFLCSSAPFESPSSAEYADEPPCPRLLMCKVYDAFKQTLSYAGSLVVLDPEATMVRDLFPRLRKMHDLPPDADLAVYEEHRPCIAAPLDPTDTLNRFGTIENGDVLIFEARYSYVPAEGGILGGNFVWEREAVWLSGRTACCLNRIPVHRVGNMREPSGCGALGCPRPPDPDGQLQGIAGRVILEARDRLGTPPLSSVGAAPGRLVGACRWPRGADPKLCFPRLWTSNVENSLLKTQAPS